VIILSDTFEQFAAPLMRHLGMPTILCHQLVVADDYHERLAHPVD
jgi:phosphoserine/homoserine phosphotransferase